MNIIKISHKHGRRRLRLECDSSLVVTSFKITNIVPWQLSTRWHNCIHMTKIMNFVVFDVYHEGNAC